jgi:DNA-binding transcriptional LysR family regulator
VHFTQDSGLSRILDNACVAAGFVPKVSVRTEQGPSAARLAASGLGPTLVPGNILPPEFEGHLMRPEPPVLRMLSAYTRTRPDPVTTAFVDVLVDDALVTPQHIRDRLTSG